MWARGSLPRYSCRSTNVGLLTAFGEALSPLAMPRTRAVFPVPNGPYKARHSPPCRAAPMAWPSRSVCNGDGSDSRQVRLVPDVRRRCAPADVLSLLAPGRLDRIRNLFDQVAGDHAGRPELSSGQISRCSM